MAQKNTNKEKTDPQPTSDDKVTAAPESQPKKKSGVVKTLGWCAFLALLGTGCYVLYDQLITRNKTFPLGMEAEEEADQEEENAPHFMLGQTQDEEDTEMVITVSEQTSSTTAENLADTEKATEETKDEVQTSEQSDSNSTADAASKQKKAVSTNEPIFESGIEPVQPAPVAKVKKTKTNYTLAQALSLRDAIQQDYDCRDQLEVLMQAHHKTPLMEKVIVAFLPQCLAGDTSDDLMTLFKKHRKQAIVSIFQQKYSTHKAHVYALPWLLIEIHQVDPEGTTPMDILDKLYYAVYRGDTQASLMYLDALPPQTAAVFNSLRQALIRQNERMELLDQLVLSFAEKGE